MYNLLNYPVILFIVSSLVLWLATRFGLSLRPKISPLTEEIRPDFAIVQGATLTLLGLIIGFSFSIATTRYDQRKNYEEEEANAIGTEYLRVDFLPEEDASKIKGLLVSYLDQRILFYRSRDVDEIRQVNSQTSQLQSQMWATVKASTTAHPAPVAILPVSGMNDVINTQGYTQAAWWNRIPVAAWCLMGVIAIWCNVLLGYGARSPNPRVMLQLILPFIVSISFFLIADIDSPRSGVIRVKPLNLISLANSLRKP